MSGDDRAQAPALVYVSWGGTGRGASVQEAIRRASSQDCPLIYLAVLDDNGFGDLDGSMIDLLSDELAWLLDAQIELSRAQVGAEDLPITVQVRAGSVVDLVSEVVAAIGPTEVLIGAPVPVAGHESVQTMLDQIEAQTQTKASLVLPGPT